MSLLLVYVLCVLTYSKFGCGSITGGRSNLSCIENEKQALLLIKKSFIDDWKLLSSWVGDDCCSWYGIECDNLTGQVTKLYHGASGLKGDHSCNCFWMKFLVINLGLIMYFTFQVQFLHPLAI